MTNSTRRSANEYSRNRFILFAVKLENVSLAAHIAPGLVTSVHGRISPFVFRPAEAGLGRAPCALNRGAAGIRRNARLVRVDQLISGCDANRRYRRLFHESATTGVQDGERFRGATTLRKSLVPEGPGIVRCNGCHNPANRSRARPRPPPCTRPSASVPQPQTYSH